MKKRIFALALVVCLLVVNCAFALDVDKAKESVARVYGEVLINGGDPVIGQYTYNGQAVTAMVADTTSAWVGSSFAVGKNGEPVKYFVTNAHCVQPTVEVYLVDENQTVVGVTDSSVIPVTFTSMQLYLVFNNIQDAKPAHVQAVSDRTDLAVLVINESTDLRKPAKLRSFESAEIKGGEAVTAIGFPAVADIVKTDDVYSQLYSSYSDMTVTTGNISKLMEHSDTQMGQLVQMTAPINGGNSGGPLFDEKGAVIGVNTMEVVDAQSTNYAVSSNEVIRLLDQEKIPYQTSSGALGEYLPYIIIAAVVVAGVVVVVLLSSKKSTKGGKPSGTPAASRTLVGNTGALAGKRFVVAKGKPAVIGRDPKVCQIVFPGNTAGVSGKHCTVRFDGTVFTVVDEGSSFGTWVDQTKLTPGTPVTVHRGQVLKIGSSKEVLQLHS